MEAFRRRGCQGKWGSLHPACPWAWPTLPASVKAPLQVLYAYGPIAPSSPQVMAQLAEISDDDVCEELEQLQSADLSAVSGPPQSAMDASPLTQSNKTLIPGGIGRVHARLYQQASEQQALEQEEGEDSRALRVCIFQ